MNKSKEFINGLLDKEIKKGTLKPEEKSNIQNNFSMTEDLNSFKNADFIVEVFKIFMLFNYFHKIFLLKLSYQLKNLGSD